LRVGTAPPPEVSGVSAGALPPLVELSKLTGGATDKPTGTTLHYNVWAHVALPFVRRKAVVAARHTYCGIRHYVSIVPLGDYNLTSSVAAGVLGPPLGVTANDMDAQEAATSKEASKGVPHGAPLTGMVKSARHLSYHIPFFHHTLWHYYKFASNNASALHVHRLVTCMLCP
jgi:hypothetical protein